MSQNTSTAVMARRVEPADRADSLDYFPTPPWATRALVEWIDALGLVYLGGQTVLEPAAGGGHMARALAERFRAVYAADVHDYGFPLHEVRDFILGPAVGERRRTIGRRLPKAKQPVDDPAAAPDLPPPGVKVLSVLDFLSTPPPRPPVPENPDWIITNPPFLLAELFIETSIRRARWGAAFLVRTAFLEGVGRHRRLFSVHPPTAVLQFVERVPMLRGRCLRGASTATAYAWLVWVKGAPDYTRFEWIAPCRARLERPGDYDDDRPSARGDLLGEEHP